MPLTMVGDFLRMIDVLKAEESLRLVSIIALGNGLVKKGEREPILQAWRREAKMVRRGKRRTTLADLSAPGLPIVEVKKNGR